MKNASWIFVSLFILASLLPAQSQEVKPLPQPTITEVLDFWVTNTERQVVPLADAMPEDKYSFAPSTTSGEFKGVRTFAEQVKHLAALNYWMAALIMEEKPTAEMESETGPDSVRTKAEIMEYLQGSFTALHQATATINQANAVQIAASPNPHIATRLAFVIDAVAHSHDHYGQLVEYLRMNGIVPPASRKTKP
jgi:uncharacterized damage-inducible protein DinB